MPFPRIQAAAAIILLALPACGPSDRVEITETLERSEYRPPDKPNATSDERFALAAPAAAPMAAPGATAQAQASGEALKFHYNVPPTWTEVAPTQFRDINFTAGANNEIECYVSILPGGDDLVAVNVNRWRGQFGQPDYTEEEIAALPKAPVVGYEAVLVNFGGTFTNMRGEAKENYHLFGAVLPMPGNLVTIKMLGPSDTIRAELNNFATFIDSLHDGTGHSHGPDDGHDHAEEAALPEPVTSANGFAWDIPEGWTYVQHPSSMRLVTFLVGEQRDTECYVVILGGNGGGRLSNFNRWLNQLGQDPLEETELELQPKLQLLGEDSPMLIAQGTYTGMGNANVPEAMLLGAAAELETQSLFIKMVGPLSTVQGQWEAFRQFCASLEQE